MGPRGPGAGAGSGGGGGGLGRRQRPRRPHANPLPAPTPLPPRGAPVLQPARSQPSASTLPERPIPAQRGGLAARLLSLQPFAAARRCRRRPRVKLQRTAPLSPPRARGWGRTGRPRRVRSDPPPRDSTSRQRIGNHAPAPCRVERGGRKRETASGVPGDVDPGPRASPGGLWLPGGWKAKRYTEETAESRGCIETGSPWGLVPTRVLCTDTVNKLFLMAVMRLSPLSAIALRLSP
ncbi:bcl-2-binding component 3, isoforms 3/4-like [Nomascus leucogenys]|uniref:bcl-2-binding component 3, isoforms 3/4-like n=1 Tax=Nomascus leucogenys TaxID=61853 RepID=UPI00122D8C13|nr:bcl-2-binding component 3, isoforms 3/4-like [Nomascus leucogenys]